MIDMNNNQETACFEVNEHGRILSGNRRFCRMFGFDESEIRWHYLNDLYRYQKDWEAYRSGNTMLNCSFIAKMRTRKGRSFKCYITREAIQDAQGRLSFHNTVRKLAEGEALAATAPETQVASSVVFLAKCDHCGCQIPMSGTHRIHLTTLCRDCARKAYPEAFELKTAQV
ncbi:MAG: PAS domain-containing protein [Fibrobacter sp.]|nr:PAS domain-containing protein [Fibrobacter sp.]